MNSPLLHLKGNKRKKRNIPKGVIIIFILYFFLCFIFEIGGLIVQAQMSETDVEKQAKEELNENLWELVNELDLQALQEYVNSLDSFSDGSVAERLINYVKGEEFDYQSFGKEILNVLFENVKEILPAFATIAAVTLLSGIISTLKRLWIVKKW